MRTNYIFSLLFISLAQPTLWAQGPIDGFFKGKRNLDLALSGGFQTADTYVGSNGPFTYERDFYFASAFGQFGITERWDVIATVPFIQNSLQDGQIWTKYGIVQKPKFTLLAAAGWSAPLNDYPTQSGQAIGQRASQGMTRLVAQYSLPLGLYVQIQGGYDAALRPVPHNYLFSTKLMYASSKWYFDVWFFQQNSLGDKVYPAFNQDFRQLAVTYSQVGATIYKPLGKRQGIALNFSSIVDGLGIFKSNSASLAWIFKMNFLKKTE